MNRVENAAKKRKPSAIEIMSAAAVIQRPYSGKPTIGGKPGSRLGSIP
jgi:hypothetical protein